MKNRIVYVPVYTNMQAMDEAIIASFAARGWVVTLLPWDYQVGYRPVPLDPGYYDDVKLLVVDGHIYSQNQHPQAGYFQGLPVAILTLGSGTATYLGMTTAATSYNWVYQFVRRSGVIDPRASLASVTMPSDQSPLIQPDTNNGVAWDYRSYSSSYAGIARRTRTVSGTAYEDVFWGYRNIHYLSGGSQTLWEAYSGGSDTSPREARAALASPLTAAGAVVGVAVSARVGALASPLGAVGAFVLPAIQVAALTLATPLNWVSASGLLGRTALAQPPSPLGRLAGQAAQPVSGKGVLYSPLGLPRGRADAPAAGLASLSAALRPPAILAAVAGAAHAAAASPLGAPSARVAQPRAAVVAVAPAPPRRLLSDPLPLRSTTDLPSYQVAALLPWVYGRVALTPLPLDAEGLEWLLADHPIAQVQRVLVAGVEIDGWELVRTQELLGHPVSLLRLTRASDTPPVVSLAGRVHAESGALLEHPADIAEDLLRQCGWAAPPGVFASLRDAWPGVALGGVLSTAESLREALSRVLGSVVADWAVAPPRAWLAHAGPVLATLTPLEIDEGTASAEHGSLVTALRVTYAYDWAASAPRGTLALEAPEAISAYGYIEGVLDLGWVRAARDALAIGSAYLIERARPRWEISLTLGPAGGGWRLGDRLSLDHCLLPRGPATLIGLTRDPTRLGLKLTRPAGVPPVVTLARRGSLYDASADAGIRVAYRDGVATFTVLDFAGDPLADASVTLDRMLTRTTDRSGTVQFTTSRGLHSLLVVAAGYASMELDVNV